MHDDELIEILLNKRNDIQLLIVHLELEINKVDELISSLEKTRLILYPEDRAINVSAIVKVDFHHELIEAVRNGESLPLNPVFAGITFIDAVQQILSVNPNNAIHRDYILKELYDEIVWETPELKQIASKRLAAILQEGRNQGRWEKIPGEQCYQLYQKKK